MSTKKTLAGLAASSLLVFLVAAPAYAEDMPEMEKKQIEGTGPNVKPGATGADKPIPEMEKPE